MTPVYSETGVSPIKMSVGSTSKLVLGMDSADVEEDEDVDMNLEDDCEKEDDEISDNDVQSEKENSES